MIHVATVVLWTFFGAISLNDKITITFATEHEEPRLPQ
jgi:hypothetical protein